MNDLTIIDETVTPEVEEEGQGTAIPTYPNGEPVFDAHQLVALDHLIGSAVAKAVAGVETATGKSLTPEERATVFQGRYSDRGMIEALADAVTAAPIDADD